MAETKEERRLRIQKENAEESAARKKVYFERQEAAKAGAEAIARELPLSDAYNYSYSWKQDPGAPTGELKLIKNVNQYYDASTNTIVDPATGKRTPAIQSMWSGPTRFRAGGAVVTDPNAVVTDPNVKDPVTGLTLAQKEAAAALAAAKNVNTTLAAQLGAKIDPNTGKIITSTIDPTKAATWYASQSSSSTTRKIEKSRVINPDGSITITYTDGTTDVIPPEIFLGSGSGSGSTTNLAAQQAAAAAAEEKRRQGQSAYSLLFSEFERYGLGALVAPLQEFIVEGLSPAEFTLRLRDTDAYKKRFAANAQRINKGLRALSEAEYIGLEDQYQDVMRRYGLPESYYTRGDMGRQEGFEKFIGGDVSPVELEDRIQTAQNRVINAAPEVTTTLKQFYPDITNGDILAYALDPSKAIENIKRKVTAAEIGAGAAIAGLATGLSRAEELQRYGVTGEQARTGYQTIGEFLPRASQLGDIYAKQGMGPFTQTTAEEEVFGTTGAVEAGKKRRKLAQLEQAQFSGTSGATGGALSRERAGQY